MGKKGQLFLKEFQEISVEEMRNVNNHDQANITVIVITGKTYRWMLKLV